MLNQKKQISQLTAKIIRLKKKFAKQQQFFRDIARLLAVFTAELETMTSILNYIIEDTDVSDILNKGRDDIIFIANAQIEVIYKNYKLDMQSADRKSKIALWEKFESFKNFEELCLESMTSANISFKFFTSQYLV